MSALGTFLSRLRRSTAAVAMTEFAMAAPLLLTAGLYGLESANLAITHMRISQAAMHIADNASRIGDTSTLLNRKIYEADINDLLLGSNLQAGDAIDLYNYGRVIVSSLEVEDGSSPAQQYIHWQRCMGRLDWQSSYGKEGDGIGDSAFVGMGPPGEEVFALEGEAVIFVEVTYIYQPLVTDAFISDRTINVYSAFNVRDDRDLSQIYQQDASNPDPVASCSLYEGYGSETGRYSDPGKAGGWAW